MRIYLANHYVSHHANLRPNSTAIIDESGVWTYGKLDAYSNRIAHTLEHHGAVRGDRVAICMEKSAYALAAMLGTLKSDAIYVNMDYASPIERSVFVLGDVEAKILLTDRRGLEKVSLVVAAVSIPIVVLVVEPQLQEQSNPISLPFPHRLASIPDDAPNIPRTNANIDCDPAYIVYTSGSTGRPKGVVVTHKSIIDYAEWCVRHFNITERDRLSSHAEFHFDLSVFDVYSALASGASLHPVPHEASLFPLKFVEFIERHVITVWCSVPSFLTHVANLKALKSGQMPSLRVVTFCGEVMPTATIVKWMTAFPRVQYVNQYGPSETTCASMYHDITELPKDVSQPLPIGIAIPNTEVFIIDDEGRPLDSGKVGELCIRGTGNALGYWNREELTKRVFFRNKIGDLWGDLVYCTGDLARKRVDGAFEFCGRADNQIKHMGYRVELGEIENALMAFDGVAHAVVVAPKDLETGATTLVGLVTMSQQIAIEELVIYLTERLPRYMVPRKIVRVDQMPLSRNGKVDRGALLGLAIEAITNGETS